MNATEHTELDLDLKKELDALQGRLDNQIFSYIQERKANAQLRKALGELQSKLADRQVEIRKLSRQISDTPIEGQDIAILQNNYKNARKRIVELEDAVKAVGEISRVDLQRKLDSAVSDRDLYRAQTLEYDKKLAEANDKYEALLEHNRHLVAKCEKHVNTIDAQQAQITELKGRVEDRQDEICRLNQKILATPNFEADVTLLRANYKTALNRITELETEVKASALGKAAMLTRIADLEGALKIVGRHDELADEREKIANKQRMLDQQAGRINDLERETTSLKADIQRRREGARKMEGEFAAVKNQLAAVLVERDRLRVEASNREVLVIHVDGELYTVNDVRILVARKTELEAMVQKLNERIMCSDKRNMEQGDQIERRNRRIAELENQLQAKLALQVPAVYVFGEWYEASDVERLQKTLQEAFDQRDLALDERKRLQNEKISWAAIVRSKDERITQSDKRNTEQADELFRIRDEIRNRDEQIGKLTKERDLAVENSNDRCSRLVQAELDIAAANAARDRAIEEANKYRGTMTPTEAANYRVNVDYWRSEASKWKAACEGAEAARNRLREERNKYRSRLNTIEYQLSTWRNE